MPREPSITQRDIDTAADNLLARGEKVTARSLSQELGKGSMTTVVKLYQVWRDALSTREHPVTDSVDKEITRAVNAYARSRIAEVTNEFKDHIAESRGNLMSVVLENERLMTENENLVNELTSQRSMLQMQSGKIDQLILNADRAREIAESETRARDLIQNELAKASLQVSTLPLLNEELKSLRAEVKDRCEEAAELRGMLIGMEKNPR